MTKEQAIDPQPTPGPWRLPTVVELFALINHEVPNQATWLNTQGFTGVQSYGYWSSTTVVSNTSDAWVVYMLGGGVHAVDKSYDRWCVWPVRAGHLPFGDSVVEACGRFTDNDDGSITDNLTGLEWAKDAGKAGKMLWQEAMDYFASYDRERLRKSKGKWVGWDYPPC